jgi:hypothetical protein
MAAVLIGTAVDAQALADTRPRRLLNDASIAASLNDVRAKRAIREQPAATPGLPLRVDVPAALKSLTNTLTASRQMRATDMTVGVALLAATTRSHHPVTSMAVVGIEAIRMGLRPPNHGRSSYDVHPDVGRHHFALTVKKTF